MEVFEPVAGNYYPITAGMYIRDEDAGLQLSILPDRAQSGGMSNFFFLPSYFRLHISNFNNFCSISQ